VEFRPAARPPRPLGLHAAATLAGGALALGVFAATGSVSATLAGLGCGALLVGIVASERERRQHAALAEIQTVLESLARSDLSARLVPTRLGPFAALGGAANRLADVLAAARERLGGLAAQLGSLPDQCGEAVQVVQRCAEEQEAAVEETAALQANINAQIRQINGEVENLARSNEESASSILELSSAVDQVASSAANVQDTVESSTVSLHQMGQSIRLVAESSDSVQQMAEETAASMSQMDRALQEVGTHVRGASDLTRRVSESADTGSQAVGATINGIAEIRELTLGAKTALEGLARRIGEIREIATAIGGITDETNLLALNAAIIAAQAGEHGKAFAVVADQVKTLARRTTHSTEEIAELIAAIQDESRNTVEAMARGIEAVEVGVSRSHHAGDCLEAIRGSAREASGRVAEIARAAEEQARNSKHVAEAARRTSEHVQQISRAMAEQSAASEKMLQNATSAVEMCRQMANATEEQRASGRYITTNIESITDMIRRVQDSAKAHERASAGVAETFSTILEHAHTSSARIPQLAAAVAQLREHASALNAEVDRFESRS
jgi:methyl-accepting chemotaxis protein